MIELRSQDIYSGTLVSITDVYCQPSSPGCGSEEETTAPKIVFPRAGVFLKHLGGHRIVADPNHILFFNAGESYQVSHPVPGGDECTSFAFAPCALRDALSLYDGARDREESPFGLTHCPVGLETMLHQQRLRWRVNASGADSLEIEETALELLRIVIRDVCRMRGTSTDRERPETLRLRREWVLSVKLLLAGQPATSFSLTEIARRIYCSPFHLARLFRKEVGLPIHQYQLRLRLALSLERLAERQTGLTEIALGLGFSSHSHFTAAFHQAFGVSPSAFRRSVTSARLREMNEILNA